MIGELLGEAAYAIEGLDVSIIGPDGLKKRGWKEEEESRPMNGRSGSYSNAYPTRNE